MPTKATAKRSADAVHGVRSASATLPALKLDPQKNAAARVRNTARRGERLMGDLFIAMAGRGPSETPEEEVPEARTPCTLCRESLRCGSNGAYSFQYSSLFSASAQRTLPVTAPATLSRRPWGHPGVGVLGGDGEGGFQAPGRGGREAVPRVVFRFAQHEEDFRPGPRQPVQSLGDQPPAPALALGFRHHRQRGQDGGGHGAFRSLDRRGGEQRVADHLVAFAGQQRQPGFGGGIAQQGAHQHGLGAPVERPAHHILHGIQVFVRGLADNHRHFLRQWIASGRL